MSGQIIEFDADRVSSAGLKVYEMIANSLITEANGLRDDFSELKAMWEGPAKLEFDTQVEEEMTYLLERLKELSGYAKEIDEAGKEYRACESDVASMIQELRV
ncbi:MAG: hypothetical protein Q4C01_04410 [Clostridia bacterium]|nr:hypothetical protein [Clostridia bacterium]